VHRVRAARQLVPDQLGPRVGERDLDLVEREVHLVGDRHGHGRRDALAHLGARQRKRRGAVRIDRDRDQARRRRGRLRQQVGQVVVVDRLVCGDCRRCGLRRAESGAGDQRRPGNQVAEKPSAGDPAGGRVNTKHL
jgi:hypothetical protein